MEDNKRFELLRFKNQLLKPHVGFLVFMCSKLDKAEAEKWNIMLRFINSDRIVSKDQINNMNSAILNAKNTLRSKTANKKLEIHQPSSSHTVDQRLEQYKNKSPVRYYGRQDSGGYAVKERVVVERTIYHNNYSERQENQSFETSNFHNRDPRIRRLQDASSSHRNEFDNNRRECTEVSNYIKYLPSSESYNSNNQSQMAHDGSRYQGHKYSRLPPKGHALQEFESLKETYSSKPEDLRPHSSSKYSVSNHSSRRNSPIFNDERKRSPYRPRSSGRHSPIQYKSNDYDDHYSGHETYRSRGRSRKGRRQYVEDMKKRSASRNRFSPHATDASRSKFGKTYESTTTRKDFEREQDNLRSNSNSHQFSRKDPSSNENYSRNFVANEVSSKAQVWGYARSKSRAKSIFSHHPNLSHENQSPVMPNEVKRKPPPRRKSMFEPTNCDSGTCFGIYKPFSDSKSKRPSEQLELKHFSNENPTPVSNNVARKPPPRRKSMFEPSKYDKYGDIHRSRPASPEHRILSNKNRRNSGDSSALNYKATANNFGTHKSSNDSENNKSSKELQRVSHEIPKSMTSSEIKKKPPPRRKSMFEPSRYDKYEDFHRSKNRSRPASPEQRIVSNKTRRNSGDSFALNYNATANNLGTHKSFNDSENNKSSKELQRVSHEIPKSMTSNEIKKKPPPRRKSTYEPSSQTKSEESHRFKNRSRPATPEDRKSKDLKRNISDKGYDASKKSAGVEKGSAAHESSKRRKGEETVKAVVSKELDVETITNCSKKVETPDEIIKSLQEKLGTDGLNQLKNLLVQHVKDSDNSGPPIAGTSSEITKSRNSPELVKSEDNKRTEKQSPVRVKSKTENRKCTKRSLPIIDEDSSSSSDTALIIKRKKKKISEELNAKDKPVEIKSTNKLIKKKIETQASPLVTQRKVPPSASTQLNEQAKITNKQAKKCGRKYNELDRLHNDIKEFYDGEGIAHSGGPRTCTIQKKTCDQKDEFGMVKCFVEIEEIDLKQEEMPVKLNREFFARHSELKKDWSHYLKLERLKKELAISSPESVNRKEIKETKLETSKFRSREVETSNKHCRSNVILKRLGLDQKNSKQICTKKRPIKQIEISKASHMSQVKNKNRVSESITEDSYPDLVETSTTVKKTSNDFKEYVKKNHSNSTIQKTQSPQAEISTTLKTMQPFSKTVEARKKSSKTVEATSKIETGNKISKAAQASTNSAEESTKVQTVYPFSETIELLFSSLKTAQAPSDSTENSSTPQQSNNNIGSHQNTENASNTSKKSLLADLLKTDLIEQRSKLVKKSFNPPNILKKSKITETCATNILARFKRAELQDEWEDIEEKKITEPHKKVKLLDLVNFMDSKNISCEQNNLLNFKPIITPRLSEGTSTSEKNDQKVEEKKDDSRWFSLLTENENAYYYCKLCLFKSSNQEAFITHIDFLHSSWKWSKYCSICEKNIIEGSNSHKDEFKHYIEHMKSRKIKTQIPYTVSEIKVLLGDSLSQKPVEKFIPIVNSSATIKVVENNKESKEFSAALVPKQNSSISFKMPPKTVIKYVFEGNKLVPMKSSQNTISSLKLRPWLMKRQVEVSKSEALCDAMLQNFYCLAAFYKCMGTTCTFYTCDQNIFRDHLLKHWMVQKEDSKNWLICSYCNYRGNIISDFIRHLNANHGWDRFQCTYCFFRACNSSSVLYYHQKMHHFKLERKVIECEPRYSRDASQEVAEIMKNIATYVSLLTCSMCPASFYTFDLYERHLISHNDKMATKCKKCCRVLLAASFQQHLLKCQGIGLYQCVYCWYGTNLSKDILNHVISCHSNRSSYYCERMLLSDGTNWNQVKTAPNSINTLSIKLIKNSSSGVPFVKIANDPCLKNENNWRIIDASSVKAVESSQAVNTDSTSQSDNFIPPIAVDPMSVNTSNDDGVQNQQAKSSLQISNVISLAGNVDF
ncbi:CLUMA_CG003421, isoform A [Clunio marinus]|uniref:CLUMA_CG003421, isoform A n=1 Tax=Clunio marinus TaxID=568069 RepID=A0A1J1HP83_9DIPT|nr:CLUMA_CG003421, isoform A [Clunio marinus]